MPTQKVPKLDKETEMFAVAMLVARNQKSYAIARNLGLTETKVRRLRTQVNSKFLLTVDQSKASSPVAIERARSMANRSELREKLHKLSGGQYVKYFKVVACDPNNKSSHEHRLLEFAKEAGDQLRDVLTNANITLVTYGITLQYVFEATNYRNLSDVRVYPACCDPYEYHHQAWSSSQLARHVSEQMKLPMKDVLSLAGMLPIISPDKTLEARQTLQKYVQDNPDYIEIYGPNGLASKANCLITSIGRDEWPWAMGHDDYFVKTVGIPRKELLSLLDAEIGSVPIPKKDLNDEQRKKFKDLCDARLGLGLEHVEAIAQRGRGTAPGVIVIAIGGNKASCLLELIKRSLVNIAIVDTELERKLMQLL